MLILKTGIRYSFKILVKYIFHGNALSLINIRRNVDTRKLFKTIFHDLLHVILKPLKSDEPNPPWIIYVSFK